MTEREREHLLGLVAAVRAEMNLRLDALALAIQAGAAQESSKKVPSKRRAPLRPPIAGPVLITDDIARKKAQQALERMGLAKVRG
jgi:hypothetical protein